MVDFLYLKNNRENIKTIFMYRVCGTGMGAAAVLLQEKGYKVFGGDLTFSPPMSTYLRSTGIPLVDLSSITSKDLAKYDLIVVGNVVPKGSDDAKKIEDADVAFASFPASIGALVLDDLNVVGFAGTHGKTTSTYLAKQVFNQLERSVGYFVGGVIDGEPSAKLGDGSYFFIESDEYDSAYFEKISKFRLYSIKHLILTSLEFDHADIFDSVDDIVAQFNELIPNVKGKKIFCYDYEECKKLHTKDRIKNSKDYLSYGLSEAEGPIVVDMNERGSCFKLLLDKKEIEFKTNLIGRQNILNLSAIILFAFSEGISIDKIKKAVVNLSLLKRRQEVRGIYKGAIVVDDFAHHPRAVEFTIETIKAMYPKRVIVTVLAPSSATGRSSIFQKEFATACFSTDKLIMVKPSSPTSTKNSSDLDSELIVKTYKEKTGNYGEVVSTLDELRKRIDECSNDNVVILILSNSTCLGLWETDFV
jgi:UDP-N-acetylmuramate: L-alanyl-gamma-D-glutamyl-meso-diaminopimelate ligase